MSWWLEAIRTAMARPAIGAFFKRSSGLVQTGNDWLDQCNPLRCIRDRDRAGTRLVDLLQPEDRSKDIDDPVRGVRVAGIRQIKGLRDARIQFGVNLWCV